MKPLTANDLVVGGKYVPHSKSVGDTFDTFKKECLIRNEPFILEHVDNFRNDYWFKTSQNRRYCFLPSDVTPYHEPNQTTMNTDYAEQPFNLETALKHPEWVYFRNGEKPLEWNWFDKANRVVAAINEVYIYTSQGVRMGYTKDTHDLILRVPYRTVWINVYKNTGYSSKEEADGVALPSDFRIACVPVKIPAI